MKPSVERDCPTHGVFAMSRRKSREAVLAVRTVKAVATGAVAGAAIVLTLAGATATPADAPASDVTAAPIETATLDARCADAAGKTLVRTPRGETVAVSFEHGWSVYRGERPGTLLVVCPG